MAREIFFVFEGGGAKGIAHVGALRAVEQTKAFRIKGAAGTSAGAIAAALVAAGYSSEEIFSEIADKGEYHSIFNKLSEQFNRPTDLFIGWQWFFLRRVRWLSRRPTWVWLVFFLIASLVFIFPAVDRWFLADFCEGRGSPVWCASLGAFTWIAYAALAGISLSMAIGLAFWFTGFASLERFAEALDTLLATKLELPQNEPVTFGMLRRSGRSLKVVASDLTTRKLRLFSTEASDCEDVAVADAVAASSAIPLVFRPVSIQGRHYCDGGMVSNLPAWTLDEHLIDDDECWVVTSETESEHKGLNHGHGRFRRRRIHGSEANKGARLIKDIAFTALFGASELNTRGINHHVQLTFPVSLGLLDFDATPQDSYLAVVKASIVSKGLLRARLDEIEFLKQIHSRAESDLTDLLGPSASSGLRCALVREIKLAGKEPVGYHQWFGVGYQQHSDGNLKQAKTGSLFEACLSNEPEGLLLDLTRDEDRRRYFGVGRPGLLESITPNDRKWVMAFPLLHPGDTRLGRVSVAVRFDGSAELGVNASQVKAALKKLSSQWRMG